MKSSGAILAAALMIIAMFLMAIPVSLGYLIQIKLITKERVNDYE